MNLTPITLNFDSQGDADRFAGFSIPRAGTLVGIDKSLHDRNGTVNSHTLDVNEGASELLGGVCGGVANNHRYGWRSTHFGGSEAPVELDGDGEYNLDVNIGGGGDGNLTVTLWILLGEV